MTESYRRSNDGSPLEVEPSTAGATGDDDLAEVGRLFIEWAVRNRVFTEFGHGSHVYAMLASAFVAGYREGVNVISAH